MIKNTAKFTGFELKLIFGEENCLNITDDLTTESVVIDSREIKGGELFVPLVGENVDGHEFISTAYETGASISICNKTYYETHKDDLSNKSVILVEDTLKGLGLLANFHRKRFEYPIIAIAGSNGKTTTKEILSHILSQSNKILKTYKNYNNQLGVPLMLLALDDSYDAAVLELGTNEPGEIPLLSEMVEPSHGVITNIGKEHLENFGDILGVELEETFLFGQLRKYNKMSYVNFDDPVLQKYANLLEKKFVFGQEDGMHLTYKIKLDDNLTPTLSIKTYNEKEFDINIPNVVGLAQAYNAGAAISIAFDLGVEIDEIQNAMNTYSADDSNNYGRMLIEKIDNTTIINDCYNANPDSMSIALETLNLYEGKKIAILGDMLELGPTELDEHKSALERAVEIADEVYLYGNLFSKIETNTKSSHHTDKDEIANKIDTSEIQTILVKGSRGMKLEELIALLK